MIDTENLLLSLRPLFNDPAFQIFQKSEWGSLHPDHRQVMKADLSLIPAFADTALFSSLSHCREFGIAVIASRPVGVDVEWSERPDMKTVARVAHAEEVSASSSASSLWCAKESAFKALRTYQQPTVISRLSIGGWKKNESQIETFELLNASDFDAPSKNMGAVFKSSNHTYSFFVFSS